MLKAPGVVILARLTLLAFLALLAGCLSSAPRAPLADSERPVIERLRDPSKPIFWPAVHRGNIEYAQGNSVQGIEASARAGALLIEIDLRRGRSGDIFLFHDRRLSQRNFWGDSSYYGKRPEDLSGPELRELCYPDSAVCAPSFEQALRAISPFRSVLLLDIENPSEEFLGEVVERAASSAQLSQIIVQCQDLAMLRLLRRKYPELALLARTFSAAEVAAALPLRPLIVQTDESWLTPCLVNAIHQSGARVLVKTIDELQDDSAHWLKLRRMGVDLILTDRFKRFAALPLEHPGAPKLP